MKKVIPAILLFIFFHSISESQTVNSRIQIVENNGANFVFDLKVSLDKDAAAVGNAVSRFLFNPNIITFPEKPVVNVDYSIHNFNSIDYLSSVSQPSDGTISLNIINMSGNSLILSDEFVDIATLRFKANGYINHDMKDAHGLQSDLMQFFAPFSASIWNVGSCSISSLGEEFIPVPLSPFNNTVLSYGEVLFNWQKIEGADYYHLEVALDESFKQIVYSVNNISDLKVIVKNIDEGTKYNWRVRSVAQGEESHFSNNSSFITVLDKPTELISSARNNYVELTWKNNSLNAENIVIERKLLDFDDTSEFEQIDTVNASSSSYVDLFVEDKEEYSYRIFAINDVVSSDYSNSTNILTSIKEEDDDGLPKDFKLQQNYPNPFNPQTTINYSVKESSQISITIYSLLGEKITSLVNKSQNAGNYNLMWNASNYPSGIYIYIMTAKSNETDNTFQNVKKMMLLK